MTSDPRRYVGMAGRKDSYKSTRKYAISVSTTTELFLALPFNKLNFMNRYPGYQADKRDIRCRRQVGHMHKDIDHLTKSHCLGKNNMRGYLKAN